MSRFKSQLDNVRVAAPCGADWDSMFGTDRQRFCGLCKLNVYNLSAMTREEAEVFVGRAEGRVCVRYYLRHDGSIITKNCPVGLAALKKRWSRVAHAFGSIVFSLIAGLGFHKATEKIVLAIADRVLVVNQVESVTNVAPDIELEEYRVMNGMMLMRDVPVEEEVHREANAQPPQP